MSRFIYLMLLLFGVELIAASKPFQEGQKPHELAFLFAGCIFLTIWHLIIWDRTRD